jgi:hypothetical protein
VSIDKNPLGRLKLLGRDYGAYGSLAATNVGARAAAGISVGSDLNSPSHRFKDDADNPNEDALCVIEAGDWAGYAVADAHYGSESSHMFIERLHDLWLKVRPTDVEHLGQMIEFLRAGDPPKTESETTLLVVCYDRVERTGFGLSFGDSSFVIVGPNHETTAVNDLNGTFVNPSDRFSMINGAPFWFSADPGDIMLTFTDGINECHYRSPETSIGFDHIEGVVNSSLEPLRIVQQLAALALSGVDGNPGGQDNIALIVSTG